MAGIDYNAIMDGILYVLRNDATLKQRNLHVLEEPDDEIPQNQSPYAAVYFAGRDLADVQQLTGMTKLLFDIEYDIRVGQASSVSNQSDDRRRRNTILREVEHALLVGHTLNGAVSWSINRGGPVVDGKSERGIWAAEGLIRLTCRAALTT